jgi:hypothetical protein
MIGHDRRRSLIEAAILERFCFSAVTVLISGIRASPQ